MRAECRTDSVTGIGAGAQENGAPGTGSGLQARRHFARMSGVDSTIMVASQQQHGRIGDTVAHVMIGRIRKKSLELIGVFHAAKFGGVESAIGIKFDTQHIVDANVRDDRLEEFGVLRQNRAHQQPAVTAAFNGKFLARCIIGADQEARTR